MIRAEKVRDVFCKLDFVGSENTEQFVQVIDDINDILRLAHRDWSFVGGLLAERLKTKETERIEGKVAVLPFGTLILNYYEQELIGGTHTYGWEHLHGMLQFWLHTGMLTTPQAIFASDLLENFGVVLDADRIRGKFNDLDELKNAQNRYMCLFSTFYDQNTVDLVLERANERCYQGKAEALRLDLVELVESCGSPLVIRPLEFYESLAGRGAPALKQFICILLHSTPHQLWGPEGEKRLEGDIRRYDQWQ